ncbi:MAG: DUF4421 family protein [Flavobacteriaceae bacterium]|nr:DUF4421 family protein [Flavobacteriaceae bacterium]
MNGKIGIDISFNNAYKTFDAEASSNRILVHPNTPNNLRFNLNYDFLSVGYQISPDFLPSNGVNEEKGKTKSFRFGTNLVFKHWFSEIEYSKVTGFFLKNTTDYDANWLSGDPFIQYPYLRYDGFSLTVGYIQNSKFSMRSLTNQTERQLKSAGTFLPVFNIDYYVLNDISYTTGSS